MKTIKKINDNFVARSFMALMAVTITLIAALLIAIKAEAASFPGPNGMKVEVVQGVTTLTLSNGSTVELTPMRIAKDGGAAIDANGTVYVIFRSGNIYWNNYALQGNNALYPLEDTDIVSFQYDSNKYATGYIKAGGTVKTVLTLEQVRQKLGLNNNTNTGNGNNGSNNNNNTNNGSNNTGNSGNTNTGNGNNNSGSSTTSSVTFKDGVVTYVGANGKTYNLAKSSSIENVVEDANHTVWIHYVDGRLYLWNYDIQKDESTVKLWKVSDKVTKLMSDGYYVAGSTSKVAFMTVSQIKSLMNPPKKVTYAYSVEKRKYVRNVHKHLYNSNGKKVDELKLEGKKGSKYFKLKYKGKTYKNVFLADFNEKGNVVFITKSKKLYVINHTTKVKKKIGSKVKKFVFPKKGSGHVSGFARYALKTNGSKINVKAK